MKRLMIGWLLPLISCTSTPTVQIVERKIPVEVKVPVEIPCKVKTPDKPSFVFDGATKDLELDVLVKLLIGESRQRAAYEHELEVAVFSCQ